jgi:hypothetical protein
MKSVVRTGVFLSLTPRFSEVMQCGILPQPLQRFSLAYKTAEAVRALSAYMPPRGSKVLIGPVLATVRNNEVIESELLRCCRLFLCRLLARCRPRGGSSLRFFFA